jgi:polyisoprenoid-binding protein YceI
MALMRWNVDKAHSDITFRVRHMVIARVRGTFGRWEAELEVDPDDLGSSRVEVRVDTASIDTREESRDAHLRSPDFFHVEEHPEMVFRSTRVEKLDGEHLKIWGELSIRDITKEIPLDVEYSGRLTDPWGNDRIGFLARGKVDRKDFGLVWNAPIEAGGVLVGDEVEISVDLEATRAKEQQQAG